MKILLSNKFYYRRGGDCVCTINLEELLKRKGHEVAIFAMQYPDNIETPWSKYFPGEVKFKLYKGNIIKAGTTSPYSLYSEDLASFTTGDMYDHHDADGFITLFGLPLKVRAMKMASLERDKK